MPSMLAHIAIAVKSINEAKEFFEILTSSSASSVQTINSQKVNVSFVELGDTHLELLEPTDDDSTIAKFLSKRGGGIHHLCLETDDFDGLIRKITSRNIRLLGEPFIGAKGKQVVFFHPKDTFNVLIELEEK
ncbi:MAG: methylmalonyl-CoA epimerase [Candidatus Kariarchaeaceae archaeon]|jgi:methylmalonyl-CoA epimerase